MADNRIKQGFIKVVFKEKNYAWFRISRTYIGTLARHWRKNPDFHYLKIYTIDNYKKGNDHKCGIQIGYITRKTEVLDKNGINDSYEAQQYKNRNIK